MHLVLETPPAAKELTLAILLAIAAWCLVVTIGSCIEALIRWLRAPRCRACGTKVVHGPTYDGICFQCNEAACKADLSYDEPNKKLYAGELGLQWLNTQMDYQPFKSALPGEPVGRYWSYTVYRVKGVPKI